VWGIPLSLSKAITLEAGSRTLEIAYKLEGMPHDFRQHLAIEFNFAGLPDRAEGRFFRDDAGCSLGELGTLLDSADMRSIGLVDEWLGVDAVLTVLPASNGAPCGLWTFPVQSVSQSEGGFELVHQSVVAMPHWIVTPDAAGMWKVAMKLTVGSPQGDAVGRPHRPATASQSNAGSICSAP
jgi:alpha-amylase